MVAGPSAGIPTYGSGLPDVCVVVRTPSVYSDPALTTILTLEGQ